MKEKILLSFDDNNDTKSLTEKAIKLYKEGKTMSKRAANGQGSIRQQKKVYNGQEYTLNCHRIHSHCLYPAFPN